MLPKVKSCVLLMAVNFLVDVEVNVDFSLLLVVIAYLNVKCTRTLCQSLRLELSSKERENGLS